MDSLPQLNRFWRQLYLNSIKLNNLNYFNGVDQQQLISRKETCDLQLISYFHNLLPLIYYNEHFNLLEKIKFKSMVNHLADTTINTISEMFNNNLNVNLVNQVQSMKNYINDVTMMFGEEKLIFIEKGNGK